MRLSLRLTLLLLVVTVVMAVVVGWFAVNSSTQSQYAVINAEINAVISADAGHPVNALVDALNVVQANSYDLTLDVIDAKDHVTQLNAGTTALSAVPTLADVRRSLHAVVSSADLPGFRYRSESAAGGDYLVVAASTAAILRSAHQLETRVALVGLLAALASILIAFLFTRRDILLIGRLNTFAGRIARGEDSPDVPPESGSPELRGLRAALVSMVGSLHRALDTERRARHEMQRFIGDASHELRTPLTVIKGYSEILERPDLDDAQRRRALDRVRREVLRMDALVADLLFLTEVREAGERSPGPVALSDVVAEAVGAFRVDHPARGVESSLARDLWVRGRAEYVERLINNALSNVARHTPGDAAVSVSLTGEGGHATVMIDDAGPGLPLEAYEKDARQFERFDPSRSRESGGTGLGMSIMGDIVASMGGRLTLAPSPLGGLRLRFELPLIEAPRGEDATG